jgi:hypothetical protein
LKASHRVEHAGFAKQKVNEAKQSEKQWQFFLTFPCCEKFDGKKTLEVKNSNRIFQLNKRNACETDLFSLFFASKSIE